MQSIRVFVSKRSIALFTSLAWVATCSLALSMTQQGRQRVASHDVREATDAGDTEDHGHVTIEQEIHVGTGGHVLRHGETGEEEIAGRNYMSEDICGRETRMYVCQRAAGPIVVDGKLTEPTWKRATWTHLFVDIEGKKKPLPRYASRAMMAWDDEYFYVAAELEEPDVWGTLTTRDAMIYEDPDFEVFIWPYDGKGWPDKGTPYYYEFEINALNTVMDALLKRLGGKDSNKREFHTDWTIRGLRHAVQVLGTLNWSPDMDEGWTVEVGFPWEALREYAGDQSVPPREGDVWRVNFSRVERVRGSAVTDCDDWVWSPLGIKEMHIPDRWGVVKFTEAVVGQR